MTDAEKKLLQAQHRLEEAQARDRVKERKAREVSKRAVKRNQREKREYEPPGYGNDSDVFGGQSGCKLGQKQ